MIEKRIAEIQLHINAKYFLIDLRQISEEEVRGSADFLSSDDIKKAMKFQARKRQIECLITTMLLKKQLGKMLGKKPSRLTLLRNPYGKPFLFGYPLHFNLSHSGHWALMGVHFDKPIGVDIEMNKREVCWESFLYPEEKKWLTKTSAVQLWSLKEAYVKALGIGFSRDLPSLEYQGMDTFLARLTGFVTLLTNAYDNIITDYKIATCIHV